MSDYPEKAVSIRVPATANFQVDSTDRNYTNDPSTWKFQISRNQSLMNGFFTRIGMTETQLDWDVAGIQSGFNNNILSFNISTSSGLLSTIPLTYQNCFVGSASNFFSTTIGRMNPLVSSMSTVMALDLSGFQWNLTTSNTEVGASSYYTVDDSRLAEQATLFQLNPNGTPNAYYTNFRNAREIVNPDFRTFRYIDFTSPQLTYNQDLKDTSTVLNPADTLQRWYFSEETPTEHDANGWIVHQGYKPFSQRRVWPVPKQVKWSGSQPIGQVSFEVIGDLLPQVRGAGLQGEYVPLSKIPNLQSYNSEYAFTCQVSEN